MTAPSRLGASDWVRREGDGFVALLLVCVVVFAALPFARLVVAALAPGGNFNPSASFAAATNRVALIATWNTIEAGIPASNRAPVLRAGLSLPPPRPDVRGKCALH